MCIRDRWYTKAAEQGHARGQYNLGYMYQAGEGVLKDHKEAVKWFTKAAEQGNAGAQGNIGTMYFYGEGVVEDYVTAYAWQIVAKANGADIEVNLVNLRSKMSPEQISVAQALARKIFQRIENKKSDNPINQRVD